MTDPTHGSTDQRQVDTLTPLIEAAQGGDPAALTGLLQGIRPMILQTTRRLLPYFEDAEEAAQDALLAIATRLETFDPARGAFRPWVRTVATNSARSTYRSMKNQRRSFEPTPDVIDPTRTSVVAGARIDLLEALEHLEREHPATLEAFMLRDLTGLSYDEVAQILCRPSGTVRAQVTRARSYVRPLLSASD